MPKQSATNDLVPTKSCAILAPLSIAGVSKNTVSVAIGSLRRGTLHAGYGDEYVFLSNVEYVHL